MTTTKISEPVIKRLRKTKRAKLPENLVSAAALTGGYSLRKRQTTATPTKKQRTTATLSTGGKPKRNHLIVQTFVAKDSDIYSVKNYPKSQQERMKYVNPKSSRRVTPFQYRVYDLVAQVPAGRVTSYKILSDVLKSSPRAVGQALRVNPFCPLPVPCHRVIAANYSIGGFAGGSGDHQFTADKRAKLQAEGCVFGEHYDFKHDKNGSTEFFDKFVF